MPSYSSCSNWAPKHDNWGELGHSVLCYGGTLSCFFRVMITIICIETSSTAWKLMEKLIRKLFNEYGAKWVMVIWTTWKYSTLVVDHLCWNIEIFHGCRSLAEFSICFFVKFCTETRKLGRMGQNRSHPVLIHGGLNFISFLKSICIVMAMIYMETSKTDWKPMEKQIFHSIQGKWGKIVHQRDMGNMKMFLPICGLKVFH